MAENLGVLGEASIAINVGGKKVDADLKAVESRAQASAKKISAAFAAIGVTAVAYGIARLGKRAVEAFNVQQQAIAQLESALASTGSAAGLTSRELQNLASDLQGVTAFGDEATIAMQSILLTFTSIRGEIFKRTVPAVQDLATRMGTDLKSAAIQLGKALNDPATGLTMLTRSGITFSESQKEVILNLAKTNRIVEAQGLILAEVETQFGGAAKAFRETFGGQSQAMVNEWGDAMEIAGGVLAQILLPAVENMTGGLEELNKYLNKSKIEVDELYDAIAKLAPITAGETLDFSKFAGAADNTGLSIEDLRKEFEALKTGLGEFNPLLLQFTTAAADASRAGDAVANVVDRIKINIAGAGNELSNILGGAQALGQKAIPVAGPILPVKELQELVRLQAKSVEYFYEMDLSLTNLEQMGVSAIGNLASAFGELAAGSFENFAQIAEAFKAMLIRMVAEFAARAAIFWLLTSLSGMGGLAGAFFHIMRSGVGKSFGFDTSAGAPTGGVLGGGQTTSIDISVNLDGVVVGRQLSRVEGFNARRGAA